MDSSENENERSKANSPFPVREGELGFEAEARDIRKSEKVTRASLAQVLSDQIGLSHQFSSEVVVEFFDTIKQALIAGESVKIQKFATFNLRDKNARPGRNPKTGEEVEVSARRVVSFKPSRRLRDLVDSRGSEREA